MARRRRANGKRQNTSAAAAAAAAEDHAIEVRTRQLIAEINQLRIENAHMRREIAFIELFQGLNKKEEVKALMMAPANVLKRTLSSPN